MKVGLEFRNELAGIKGGFWIVQQLDRILAGISGIWKLEHLDNGQHGDVIATSVSTPFLAVTSEAAVDRVFTARGAKTIATATATTVFSVESNGLYQVTAFLANAGDAGNYAASAVVMSTGTGWRITADNGALLTITLSGSDVQLTQTSGSSQAVSWSYVLIR
jgi:hypothetical protein